jgi:hypothetical protein
MARALARTVFLCLLFALPGASLQARSICLSVQTAQTTSNYPVRNGDELRLTFRHSIYGSAVEEQFRLTERGLQPVEFRYGEARLVEFYGYDSAIRVLGRWIVRKPGAVLRTVDVQSASPILVTFRGHELTLATRRHAKTRLAITAC